MTPYEKLLADKEKICCTNCKYLHQEPKKNKTEGTGHVNYCTKSGKIVLEMHIDTVGKTKKCFKRK